MLRCPRAVALDLHEDKSKRRPLTEAEEFSRQRGRDLEARLVKELGYPEPEYPERDLAAGAAATQRSTTFLYTLEVVVILNLPLSSPGRRRVTTDGCKPCARSQATRGRVMRRDTLQSEGAACNPYNSSRTTGCRSRVWHHDRLARCVLSFVTSR
jgi:hypothetical protein